MVHYLKFDARNGTHVDPDYAGGGSYAAIELLKVTDVLMVTSESATSQDVVVYYNIFSGRQVPESPALARLQQVVIRLSGAQTDYNFTNWLRDQIRGAIEMTNDGPSIMDVTSVPPVLPEDIYAP